MSNVVSTSAQVAKNIRGREIEDGGLDGRNAVEYFKDRTRRCRPLAYEHLNRAVAFGCSVRQNCMPVIFGLFAEAGKSRPRRCEITPCAGLGEYQKAASDVVNGRIRIDDLRLFRSGAMIRRNVWKSETSASTAGEIGSRVS